jgi:hypothetical protein
VKGTPPITLEKNQRKEEVMPANSKQGTYLGTTLAGFTALPAGLYAGGGLGTVVAIVGAGLLIFSAAGFYKIKNI